MQRMKYCRSLEDFWKNTFSFSFVTGSLPFSVPVPVPVLVPEKDIDMDNFDHDKLDVYQASIEFIAVVDEIVKNFPRGRGYLADQLQRAGTSVPLNISEGAGEFSGREKARFYRMAKRSATECAAILDVCLKVRIINKELFEKGRVLLLRIVSMLTKMARVHS